MNNDIITLEMYITANGRYPERLKNPELTDELRANALKLLEKINQLLRELNINKVDISSGWRPPEVNKNVHNAAKNSAHQLAEAIDIIDDNIQSFAKKLQDDYNLNKENSLIVKNSLYMESPNSTIGKNSNWCHLQIRPTINRIFLP